MSFRSIILSIVALFVALIASANVSPAGNVTTTSPQPTENSTKHQTAGWTAQPNGRGTIDILWSCMFTMFLCSWSVLCLNVPASHDSEFHIFRRKVYLSTLAFLGPEFLFLTALGQFVSAKSVTLNFHNSGHKDWTPRHSFFADMGGFVLSPRDFVAFPINGKQLHFLVTQKHIQLPSISNRTIKDRNKVDGLLRIVTVCQTLWFIVQICGRAYQHLAITCVELTTAGFIVCSVGTTYCWADKPAGMLTSEVIVMDTPLADILRNAGERAKRPYYRTPLDFVSRDEWHWSLYWSNWINILRNMGIVFDNGIKPIDRFGNADVPKISRRMNYMFLVATSIYCAIFICGWNYQFPTPLEQTLWRAASITGMGTMVFYQIVTEIGFSIYPALERRFSHIYGTSTALPGPTFDVESSCNHVNRRRCSSQNGFVQTMQKLGDSLRNNSLSKDPALTLPLKAIVPIHFLGFCYCVARLYMYVADLIELRSLPESAYLCVDWTSIFPHI